MKIPLTPIRFLRYAREQFSKKVGVICGDQRFIYEQFAERSARLAGAAPCSWSEAWRPGRVPEHQLSPSAGSLLRGARSGLLLIPLNVRLGSEELAFVLDDAQPRFLFHRTRRSCLWLNRSEP